MVRLKLLAAGLALLPLGAAPASAADDMFDVAFGAAVTSDYVSRGLTQTDGDPAVQGYLELDYGIFYTGAWASNVKFGGDSDTEIDLSIGLRPELDKWSFDFGYVQYVYANDVSPTYGEIYANADYAATDALTLGGKLYVAPDYSQGGGSATYVEGNLDVSLPANFGVSGALGYQSFASGLGLPDYLTWNAGVYWTWNDTWTVDLRYSDTNLSGPNCGQLSSEQCGARFMATLSVDTSMSALSGN